MKRQRALYLKKQRDRDVSAKLELERALKSMQVAVSFAKRKYEKEDHVIRIQRSFRKFLNRKRFAECFYKLMVFNAVVENKMS